MIPTTYTYCFERVPYSLSARTTSKHAVLPGGSTKEVKNKTVKSKHGEAELGVRLDALYTDVPQHR